MSRQSIIQTAASQDGVKENPPNSNKNIYGQWYGMDGVRWCAIFVSWVFNKAGHPLGKIDSQKGYHYCPSAYNYWRRNKMLTSDPQPGDIVLFDWDGDALSDHTGIFNQWINKGVTFTAWEGNTSPTNDSNGGKVSLRTRSMSTVQAFVNPGVFGDQSMPQPDILKKGSRGTGVTQIQNLLIELKYPVVADGVFGPKTEAAVKDFQTQNKLTSDGEVGDITLGALQGAVAWKKQKTLASGSILRKGSTGGSVVILQQALNKANTKLKLEEDGVFGTKTVNGLKAFQKKKKLKVDGVAGPQVWKALGID